MAIIDFSKFTFTAEQIRDIRELMFDEFLNAPDLNFIHTMFSGIKYDEEVGFIVEGGLVGKAKQGCNPTADDWSVGTRKVTWKPKAWEVIIDECASKFSSTMAVYCQKNGVSADDLTDTDYMAIVAHVLAAAIKKMLYRIVWFSDANTKNVTAGGIITDGIDTDYFTVIDAGFFKQIQSSVTAHPEHLVTIDANAKATKKEQLEGLTPEGAYNILSKMFYAAPVTMRANMQFLVTQTIADAYQQYLTGKGIESEYKNLVDGVSSLKFLGKDIIPMPIWDEMIQSFNDLGAKFSYPHRAVLIEKANLAVGTPTEGAIEDIDIIFDKMTRVNRLQASDKIDAELLNEVRVVYAQ